MILIVFLCNTLIYSLVFRKCCTSWLGPFVLYSCYIHTQHAQYLNVQSWHSIYIERLSHWQSVYHGVVYISLVSCCVINLYIQCSVICISIFFFKIQQQIILFQRFEIKVLKSVYSCLGLDRGKMCLLGPPRLPLTNCRINEYQIFKL